MKIERDENKLKRICKWKGSERWGKQKIKKKEKGRGSERNHETQRRRAINGERKKGK